MADPDSKLHDLVRGHIAKRIREGALLEADIGKEGLLAECAKKFAKEYKAEGAKLTRKWFDEQVEALLWTDGADGTLTVLRGMVRSGVPLQRFHKHHAHIPFKLVEKKARELRGLTTSRADPARSLHGINRLSSAGGFEAIANFETPATSSAAPFAVKVKDAKNWRAMVLNGANLGIKYAGTIEDNAVRQALSNAERAQCDAVFITNALDIDMVKASGPLKALRALFSGRNINTALLEPTYQAKAERILRDMPLDELVYETANEAFANLLSGWHKICLMPEKAPYDGRPEYSGPIYIVFGYKEEELVAAAAYWEALYFTNRNREELEAELKAARSALADAIKHGTAAERSACGKVIGQLVSEIARTRMTPVPPQEWQRFYPRALAHVISRFEAMIPNSKVIGVNTTHIAVGGTHVELHIPDHLRISDTLLSKRVAGHGPAVLRGTCADMTVVCHPYALNARVTARERDSKGKRGHAYFAVAPICVDAQFLRDAYKTNIRKAHPMGKVVFSEQTHTGVLMLECTDGIVMPPSVFSIGSLAKFRLRTEDFAKEAKGAARIPLMAHPSLRYLWKLIFTDTHVGARNRETIWCKETETRLGMFESIAHLMRKEGLLKHGSLPIHLASSNDDFVHGNHFGTHLQPHVNEMSFVELQDLWRKKMESARGMKTRGEVLELFAQMQELALWQTQIRGIDWTANQMTEAFERVIAPNVDMFDAILSRAKKSSLIVRGISEHTGLLKDSRDIGVISIGTGNHFERTVDRALVEGPIFAHAIRNELAALPHWQGKRDELKKLVRAPLDGNRFIGYGTAMIPGGYEWGFDMRDTPTGGVDWNDPLRNTVTREMRRGNVPRIFENKVIVKDCGDKHFLSQILTSWAYFVMGAPGTHTDTYGEHGFPPNNTGMTFLGLPVDGPDGGPILLRALLFDDIKRLVEENAPIDWARILPNPA